MTNVVATVKRGESLFDGLNEALLMFQQLADRLLCEIVRVPAGLLGESPKQRFLLWRKSDFHLFQAIANPGSAYLYIVWFDVPDE